MYYHDDVCVCFKRRKSVCICFSQDIQKYVAVSVCVQMLSFHVCVSECLHVCIWVCESDNKMLWYLSISVLYVYTGVCQLYLCIPVSI